MEDHNWIKDDKIIFLSDLKSWVGDSSQCGDVFCFFVSGNKIWPIDFVYRLFDWSLIQQPPDTQ